MPKIVKHDEVRIAIVEAAARVIARVGLQRASVRAIAIEAGYSPAAPLHYFGTREALFDFAFDYFCKQSLAQLEHAARPDASIIERIGRVAEVLLDRSAGDIFFARLMIGMVIGAEEGGGIRKKDTQTHQATLAFMVNLLAEARAEGLLPSDADLQAEADLIVTLADGLTISAVTLGEDALSMKERLKSIVMGRFSRVNVEQSSQ